MKILVVDDEQTVLSSVRRLLRRRGYMDVSVCDQSRLAIEKIGREKFDIVLLDLIMPDLDGLSVLKSTKADNPGTEFIIITGVDDVTSAVKAVRLGAYDYLVKPVDNQRLILSIDRAYERKGLLSGLAGSASSNGRGAIPEAFSEIITHSPRMKELLNYAAIMARSHIPILITGESGTGKELLARGIHRASRVRKGPFVAVNVAAVPATLFESQFFGHLKGAYTGAESDWAGFFQQAHGGSLFLDEIGDLPMNLQAKLLRVLETKSVMPIGAKQPVAVDVRIISATNQDLSKACRENRFRSDLIFRLKGAQVHLPPLRERKEDIPYLAGHFLVRAAKAYDKRVTTFSNEAMAMLMANDYPGNIRELSQMVETATLVAESATILPHHLGAPQQLQPSFERTLCSMKENADIHLAYVLAHTKGDRKQAATILGVTPRQVYRKISQLKNDSRWETLLGDI